jgi:hypothetical protein
MARTRSIKPDFWNHPLVIECSAEARLLFIGLWSHCDDGGRHPATPKVLKGKVFPADTYTAEQVTVMLKELCDVGLLKPYPANGMTFLEVADWKKWQTIKSPTFQWPDETGTVPGRKRSRTVAEQAPAETPSKPASDGSAAEIVTPKPEKPTRQSPAKRERHAAAAAESFDPLMQHADQIAAYSIGKWRLEWGNPPGAGCLLPESVQAHMLEKFGVKELVIE